MIAPLKGLDTQNARVKSSSQYDADLGVMSAASESVITA